MTDRRRLQLVWAFAALFVALQCMLVWDGGTNGVFNSPDANANYHYALRLYQGDAFGIPLPTTSSDAGSFLFTRSTYVTQGMVLPVGFLGLSILYGLVSKILFINLIPYLTIIIAGIAVVSWYRIVQHFFSSEVGYVASLLLLSHPAWWYYTNESLMPNVLFTSLLMIAVHQYLMALEGRGRVRMFCSALLIVGALWVRLSEAIWLLPVIALMPFAVSRNRYERIRYSIVYWVLLIVIATMVWAVQQYITGVSAVYGYAAPAGGSQSFSWPWSLVLPFGFHPRLIALHVWQYGLRMFWPYTVAALISVWVLGISYFRHARMALYYYGVTGVVALYIMVVYGSWYVVDAPDPSLVTIGTSYVRYFLPWYVLVTLPLIATGFLKTLSYLGPMMRRVVVVGTVLGVVYGTYAMSMIGSPESIYAKRETLRSYDALASWVRESTPVDSIILTAKGDKYLWPHRWVVTAVERDDALQALAYFLKEEQRQLWYIGVTMDEEKKALFSERLQKVGLVLKESVYTNRDVSVYTITDYHE